MTKTLALTDAWDLYIDGKGDIAMHEDKPAIAQDVASSVRLFRNDAYYSRFEGIPYWTLNGLHFSVLKAEMRNRALAVPYVTNAEITFMRDAVNRILQGDIIISDALPPLEAANDIYIDDFYSVSNVYAVDNVYKIRVRYE
jgi:hypothetical protein